MSVQLLLLEDFLITVVPPETRLGIQKVFAAYRKNPVGTLLDSFKYLPRLYYSGDAIQQANTITATAMGIVMAASTENPEIRTIFQNWLEAEARARGENVYDFFTKGRHNVRSDG